MRAFAQRCAWTKGHRRERIAAIMSPAMRKCAEWSARAMPRKRRRSSLPVKPRGDEAKGACAPWDSGNCNARLLGGHAVRFKIERTQRRVTTATPVRSAMEQGKEPSQRSLELTAHEWLRQEDATNSRPYAGAFAWHPYSSLLASVGNRTRPGAVVGWRGKRLHGAAREAGGRMHSRGDSPDNTLR